MAIRMAIQEGAEVRGDGDSGAAPLRGAVCEGNLYLVKKLAETRQELFNLRFQSATGALENTARMRMAKREIARVLSIRNGRDTKLERK